MRRFLDGLYRAALWAAAFMIVAMCTLIAAQVLLNFSTRVLGLPLPPTIPSYADFAGFLLAGATFLALPGTLRDGGHIRVDLITARLAPRPRLWAELLVLTLGAGIAGYATYYAALLVEESHHYGDVSSGIIPVPLWIPQVGMTAGLALLTLAFIDTLLGTTRAGTPLIGAGEES